MAHNAELVIQRALFSNPKSSSLLSLLQATCLSASGITVPLAVDLEKGRFQSAVVWLLRGLLLAQGLLMCSAVTLISLPGFVHLEYCFLLPCCSGTVLVETVSTSGSTVFSALNWGCQHLGELGVKCTDNNLEWMWINNLFRLCL